MLCSSLGHYAFELLSKGSSPGRFEYAVLNSVSLACSHTWLKSDRKFEFIIEKMCSHSPSESANMSSALGLRLRPFCDGLAEDVPS